MAGSKYLKKLQKSSIKDRIKKSMEEATPSNSYTDSRLLKIALAENDKSNSVVVRFLPPKDFIEGTSDIIMLDNHKHYFNHGTKIIAFNCLRNINQECALCNSIWDIYKGSSKDYQNDVLKPRMANRRYVINAYIIKWKKNKEMEGNVALLDIPFTIANKIRNALDEEKDVFDISEDGYNFYINVEPKKLDSGKIVPNYESSLVGLEPCGFLEDDELDRVIDETWNLDEFHNSDDYLPELEVREIVDSLDGLDLKDRIKERIEDIEEKDLDDDIEEEEEDEDLEKKLKKSLKGKDTKSKTPVKKSKVEEEPDDDDFDDDDLEEEEEEYIKKPLKGKDTKSKTPVKKSKVEEEDDIDLDDIEDDGDQDLENDDNEEDDIDLDALDKKELITFMKNKNLIIKDWKKLTEDDLRDAIEDAIDELELGD